VKCTTLAGVLSAAANYDLRRADLGSRIANAEEMGSKEIAYTYPR
jgi:hypothetical protein